MRITFWGTSHGVPECNRRCSCTMLEVSGRYYFVDMGMSPVDEMVNRGISFDSVKAVFITHPHGDHSNGLIQFIDPMTWIYKTPEPEIFIPDMKLGEALNNWLLATGPKPRLFEYSEVREGEIFDDGFIKVTAKPNKHCTNSYSYIIEAEGKTLMFTGDLNHDPTTDLPFVLPDGHIDFMVAEAAHFNVEIYKDLLSGRDIDVLYINHLNPKNALHTAVLAKNMTEIPVKLATDGLVVKL